MEHRSGTRHSPCTAVGYAATLPTLTYMATIANLLENGFLVALDITLDGRVQPWRRLVASPQFVTWVQRDLPNLESSSIGCEITPIEQVDALFSRFVSGETLHFDRQFHCLRPSTAGIWELKTIDVRVFGWFYAVDLFIAFAGSHADIVKDRHLYPGYRDQAKRHRDLLDLDEPKYVPGDSAHDVISIANQRSRS